MKALVPLDGSEAARSVLPAAHSLLRLVPAVEIHLLTVLDPRSAQGVVQHAAEERAPMPAGGHGPAIGGPLPRVVESHGEAMDRMSTEAREELEMLARAEFPGTGTVCTVEWSRKPAEAIGARAEAIGADLVVMATHGRSGISHLVAGSVTEEVIRTCGRPVLVICPKGVAEPDGQ